MFLGLGLGFRGWCFEFNGLSAIPRAPSIQIVPTSGQVYK